MFKLKRRIFILNTDTSFQECWMEVQKMCPQSAVFSLRSLQHTRWVPVNLGLWLGVKKKKHINFFLENPFRSRNYMIIASSKLFATHPWIWPCLNSFSHYCFSCSVLSLFSKAILWYSLFNNYVVLTKLYASIISCVICDSSFLFISIKRLFC